MPNGEYLNEHSPATALQIASNQLKRAWRRQSWHSGRSVPVQRA